MKYFVSTAAILHFADGSRVNLFPGIHSFDEKVIKHWAFSAHAKAVDDSDIAKEQKNNGQKAQLKVLQGSIKQLTGQLEEKDKQIAEKDAAIQQLTGQLKSLTPPPGDKQQETDGAKKQSSTNK